MIELWPYVNGRALIHGQQLSGMEASDMLDVAYYLLESDLNASTLEQSKAQVAMRESLYKSIYNKDYKYSEKNNKNRSYDFDAEFANEPANDDIKPFNPTQNNVYSKEYMNPTAFDEDSSNPFGELLDPPMN